MKTITLEKLADITGLTTNTMRQYLGGYRFTKYKLIKDYEYSKGFVDALLEFFEVKRKIKEAKALEEYIKNFNEPEF